MDRSSRSAQVQRTCRSLGHSVGEGYSFNEKCDVGLEEILHKISSEDKSVLRYRRNICFGEHVRKDLIPLFINAKDQKTIELMIRILVNLTTPIESILPADIVHRADVDRNMVPNLKKLIYSCKLEFVDPRVIKVVLDFMNGIIENESKLSFVKCEQIYNCLTLLRNVLLIPEGRLDEDTHSEHPSSVQNQILWNMFSQGGHKMIIDIILRPEADNWVLTTMQFITLLYKDHHKEKLQKLMDRTHEVSMSDTSEDNVSNIVSLKELLIGRHQPTDEDVAAVLKEFTIDFLLTGYKTLAKTLITQMLNPRGVQIDRFYFPWLIVYFLMFTTQMKIDFKHVDSILCYDVISYLAAEGGDLCQQYERAVNVGAHLGPYDRRLHLVVSAIREFLEAVEGYVQSSLLSSEQRATVVELQLSMWNTAKLSTLMVLLITTYDPLHQTKQHLQNIVVANHILLRFLDSIFKLPGYTGKFTMIGHLKQFASPRMMRTYGLLLEEYETNGEFVNNCIFTMMHQVIVGTVNGVQALYQPRILRTFHSLKATEHGISTQWEKLIEYVVDSFSKRCHEFKFDTSSATAGGELYVFAKPMQPTTSRQGF